MKGDTQSFPAISINQFADPVSFVSSWCRLFHYDEQFANYVQLKNKEEWTESDLQALFEWFDGREMSKARLMHFRKEIAARTAILNAMKSEVAIYHLYLEFGHLGYNWYHFLAHIVINYRIRRLLRSVN